MLSYFYLFLQSKNMPLCLTATRHLWRSQLFLTSITCKDSQSLSSGGEKSGRFGGRYWQSLPTKLFFFSFPRITRQIYQVLSLIYFLFNKKLFLCTAHYFCQVNFFLFFLKGTPTLFTNVYSEQCLSKKVSTGNAPNVTQLLRWATTTINAQKRPRQIHSIDIRLSVKTRSNFQQNLQSKRKIL